MIQPCSCVLWPMQGQKYANTVNTRFLLKQTQNHVLPLHFQLMGVVQGKRSRVHHSSTGLVLHAESHTFTHTHTSQAITVWRCQERQQIWVLESVGLTVELKIDVKKRQRDGGMEGNLDIIVEQITLCPFFFFLQHKHLCHNPDTPVCPVFVSTVITNCR